MNAFVFFLFPVLLILYNYFWKRRNLPPGPTPLPLFGNRLTIERLAPGYKAFQQWSKQYGPVFTFWVAEDPVVAVTDFDLIKKAFIKDGDAYAGRDLFPRMFEAVEFPGEAYGVGKTQGEEWIQLRRFTFKVFRDLDMGRKLLEHKIMLDVDSLLESVEIASRSDARTEGINLIKIVDLAIGSIINHVIFGYRFVGDRANEFHYLKARTGNLTKLIEQPISSVVVILPWLRFFPIFSAYFREIDYKFKCLYQYFDHQILTNVEDRKKENRKDSIRSQENTYFLQAFLDEMENRSVSGVEDPYFNMKSLRGMCFDLFVAGQETTANTINFLILYMIRFPEVQTKMQEELDRVIGDNEEGHKRICLADKAKLPYTNAVINETQRFCNVFPINLLHRTTKEVECGGFKIAKGTRVVPLISCVLYDEKIFPEPQKFMPERFIENGQLKKCEELIPFSIGKRQCLGESLARAELFLFTANLLYLYKIRAVDEEKLPSLEKKVGVTVAPMDYRCIAEKRKQVLFD